MAITCDRCLNGRHSILCETGSCACSICTKPSASRYLNAKKKSAVRKKYPRRPEKPRGPRVLTAEQRLRYSEAQKLRYRESRNDPSWVWNNEDFSERLQVLFHELSKEEAE